MDHRGFAPLFLPPYTPQWQPIEHCFSVLKTMYRRQCVSYSEEVEAVSTPLRVSGCIRTLETSDTHAAYFAKTFRVCLERAARNEP